MEGVLSFLLFAGFFYFMMRFGCGAHMVHGHGEHRGHEHGGDREVGTAIDPVCGMPVAPEQGYTKMYQGRERRFCSRACLDRFEANPDRYLAISGGVR